MRQPQCARPWANQHRGLIAVALYVSAIICLINVWNVSSQMFALYGANNTNNQHHENAAPERIQTSGAVIATKILGPKKRNGQKNIQALKEWICLINAAYNDKAKHDIVVFTTMPWADKDILKLQEAAAPRNLTVALEGPSLEEQLAEMTDEEVKFLRKRCGIEEDNNETLTYFHHCTEPNYRYKTRLGYSWQAEFRAYHIWKHPAIQKYKYMIWLDTDALVGKLWDVDPLEQMIEHDLTIMYAQFPGGAVRNNAEVGKKLIEAYGTNICGVATHNDGKQIHAKVCNDENATVDQIGGNHHITNLDVFRKDIHQKFLKSFVGPYRFRRSMDDQTAVTIVSTMEQYIRNNYTTEVPERPLTWHERSNGMTLKIGHHDMFDGKRDEFSPRNRGTFYDLVEGNFTGLEERCRAIFKK